MKEFKYIMKLKDYKISTILFAIGAIIEWSLFVLIFYLNNKSNTFYSNKLALILIFSILFTILCIIYVYKWFKLNKKFISKTKNYV